MTATGVAALLIVLVAALYAVVDRRSRYRRPVPVEDIRTAVVIARLETLADRFDGVAARIEQKYDAEEGT